MHRLGRFLEVFEPRLKGSSSGRELGSTFSIGLSQKLRFSNSMTPGHFLEAGFVYLFHKSPEKSLFCYSFPPHLKSQKEEKSLVNLPLRFLIQLQLTEIY